MRVRTNQRTGTVAALLAVLLLPLLAMLALFVDYGFLLYIRTDLQRSADQVALAAVRDLLPDDEGNQDTDAVQNRIQEYLRSNMGDSFQIRPEDVVIGRYDPDTIYDSVDIVNDGIFDTVRVTLRRNDVANRSVALYFARLFDRDQSDVSATATAVLQRGRFLPPGSGVLPFAVPNDLWAQLKYGDDFNIYGDGQIQDATGQSIPGNWGTVDIGPTNNSTNALGYQIVNGLTQNDLDSLHGQGAIPDPSHIDSQHVPLTLNADPGFSAGIKDDVRQVHGQTRVVPIYDASKLGSSGSGGGSTGNGKGKGKGKKNSGTSSGGGGNNLNYEIVGWGVVRVVDSSWNGSQNSSVNVKKAYLYDGLMTPNPDLSDLSQTIEGVFTSPVLVE